MLESGALVTALLALQDVVKHFPVKGSGRVVHAVNGVSLDLLRGETLGIVGESGCGKSTLGRLALRLIEPDRGEVRFEGENLRALSAAALRAKRREMQIVFQDPYASLDPRQSVADILAEPLKIHARGNARSRRERVAELLRQVGLPADAARRYPHEFSGGQRQRIGIARALALEPSLLIADEPVSALDVSIQAQVINLFMDLQERLGLTYLFIAHDLAVVRHISTRIAVMYLGRLVEIADRDELYQNPLHPYTEALMAAVPVADPEVEAKRPRAVISGEVPSALRPPPGCAFHTRCPRVMARCKTEQPRLRDVVPGRAVACHLHD
jgi:peptide/nickel transport system ATP-binding protein